MNDKLNVLRLDEVTAHLRLVLDLDTICRIVFYHFIIRYEIWNQALGIGITLKRGVIYFCHEAKPRGRNISTRVFV